MFKAKDIMVKSAITTQPDMPIYDAIRILANRNLSGLPVVDEELNLVGVLSEKDVLRLLYDTVDRVEQTVSDYMSGHVVSFDVNDSLVDLCDCLVERYFRRVPITDKGKLAGIVTRSEVIRAILKIKKQAL